MSPSPLTKAFETVRTNLRGVIKDYGEGAPQPVHELGEEHLQLLEEQISTEQAKPSIVWVPIGGPGKLEGNLRSATSIRNPAGVAHPRQLMSVENRVDVYFWTASIDETWWLFSHWLHVARTTMTAYTLNEPMAVRWAAVGSKDEGRGTYLIFSFHLSIPVTFEPQPYARAPITPVVTGQIVAANQITTPQGEELP